MKAVILSGGLGSRLRPLTFTIPKPLLPIGEKPILEILLKQLKKYDIKEIILSVGYQSELIETFCQDGSRFGIKIDYIRENKPLGTAGPLPLLKGKFKKGEIFILINGDIFTKLNFSRLANFSAKENFDITIGYTKFIYHSPFGVLKIKDKVLQNIVEKPSKEYNISAGIYVIKSSVIDFVPVDTYFSIPDLVNLLLKEGKRIGVYQIREFWLGIEHISHFDQALEELKKMKLNI